LSSVFLQRLPRPVLFLALALTAPVAFHAQQAPSPAAASGGAPDAQVAGVKPPDESAALTKELASATDEAGSTSAAASTNDEGVAGIVPITKGFNASLVTASQHDSSDGWSSILTPNIAYRFGRHFSANVEVPVFAYIDVVTTKTTKNAQGVVTSTTSALATRDFLLGDTTLSGAFEAHPKLFDYNITATLGMPSGDNADGLGAGQFTYEFNNHFEHPLGDYVTPALELGIGDSTSLTDTLVRKSYIDVGTNAHFQFGFGFSLPREINFETDAYEDLPLASQTVTSTTTNGKKGKQLKIITTSKQEGIGEDNGFLNTLDIPLNGHVTLSGFYNRSLRNKIDTAGFSLTFLLRAPPRAKELSH
jgi:hypothetical protein